MPEGSRLERICFNGNDHPVTACRAPCAYGCDCTMSPPRLKLGGTALTNLESPCFSADRDCVRRVHHMHLKRSFRDIDTDKRNYIGCLMTPQIDINDQILAQCVHSGIAHSIISRAADVRHNLAARVLQSNELSVQVLRVAKPLAPSQDGIPP